MSNFLLDVSTCIVSKAAERGGATSCQSTQRCRKARLAGVMVLALRPGYSSNGLLTEGGTWANPSHIRGDALTAVVLRTQHLEPHSTQYTLERDGTSAIALMHRSQRCCGVLCWAFEYHTQMHVSDQMQLRRVMPQSGKTRRGEGCTWRSSTATRSCSVHLLAPDKPTGL